MLADSDAGAAKGALFDDGGATARTDRTADYFTGSDGFQSAAEDVKAEAAFAQTKEPD